MELNDKTYIKKIEWFYLKIRGKGLMLSSKDYNLINNWYKRSIPKQILMQAIQSSFKDCDANFPRNISDIEYEVNQFIKNNYLNKKRYDYDNKTSKNILKYLISELNHFISNEKRANIKRNYLDLKSSLDELYKSKSKNVLLDLKRLEYEFYQKLYSTLSIETKEKINNKANKMMTKESRFYDKKTRETTLMVFRNDLILSTLKIKNVFDLKNYE